MPVVLLLLGGLLAFELAPAIESGGLRMRQPLANRRRHAREDRRILELPQVGPRPVDLPGQELRLRAVGGRSPMRRHDSIEALMPSGPTSRP